MVGELFRAWGLVLRGYRPVLSIEITTACPLSCPGCYAYQPAHVSGAALESLKDHEGDALVAGMSYGACLILLGLSRGRIRTAIEGRAQELQAGARKSSRGVESNPSTAATRRRRRSTRARPSSPEESRE